MLKIKEGSYGIDFSLKEELKSAAKVEKKDMKADLISDLELTAVEKENVKKTNAENIGSGVIYRDVKPGIDLEYILQGSGVKENIYIKEKIVDPTLTFEINVSGLTIGVNDLGNIELKDKKTGKAVYEIPKPFMYDDNQESSDAVEFKLDNISESKATIKYIPDSNWLNAKERAYPVVIDPPVISTNSIVDIHDTFVDSTDATDKWLNTYIRAGKNSNGGTRRGFVQVPLPAIGSGDVVIKSTMNLYADGAVTTGSNTVYVHKNTSAVPNVTYQGTYWSNQQTCNAAPDDYKVVSAGTSGWNYFDITDIAQDWYTNGGNYGVAFRADGSTTGNNAVFLSSDTTNSTIRPSMIVQYINSIGLESYQTYHTQDAGRGGTVYVNDYTGDMTIERPIMVEKGEINPLSITAYYNGSNRNSNGKMGYGWSLNIFQGLGYMAGTYFMDGVGRYTYTDADGTVHYYIYDSATGEYRDPESSTDTYMTPNSSDSTHYYDMKDKNGNHLYFSSAGRLTRIADKNGNLIDINFDANNLPISAVSKNANGEVLTTTTLAYNGNSKLSTITDSRGKVYTFTYTAAGCIDKITDSDGEYGKYEYTAAKVINWVYGSTGGYYRYDYTSSPYRVKGIYERPNYGTVNLTSDPHMSISYEHNFTKFTDFDGKVNIYQYNDLGQCTGIIDNDGNAIFNSYGSTGNQNNLKSQSKVEQTIINYLYNTSFQNTDTKWTYSNGSGGSAGTGSYSTTEKYSDTKSYKIDKTNAADKSIVYQNSDLVAGKTYTLSGYIKTTVMNTGAKAYLKVTYGSGGENVAVSEEISSVKDWDRYSTTFTVPANYTVKVELVVEGGIGTVYFDAIQLEEGKTANRYNIINNGSFLDGFNYYAYHGPSTPGIGAGREGRNAAYINGSPAYTDYAVAQVVYHDGKQGDSFTYGVWAKADSAPSDKSIDSTPKTFALKAKIYYTENGVSKSEYFGFKEFNDAYTDWQYLSIPLVASRDYDSLVVFATYDGNINKASFTDWHLYKDDFGSSYTYDSNGNVVSVKDNAEQESTFSYTGNNLTGVTNPNGGSYTYDYSTDGKNNLLNATTATGIGYEYTYNNVGRVETNKITTQNISYRGYNDYKWLPFTNDGNVAGVLGIKMSAFQMKLGPNIKNGSIKYRGYISGTGWESWKDESTYVGAGGKTIEALDIELDGDAADDYDIYYSVNVRNFGWLGWAKNGEDAGSSGYGYSIDGIKVVVVAKGAAAPGVTTGAFKELSTGNISYRGYIDYSWLAWTNDGNLTGVLGSKMSAFKMQLGANITDGSIKYRGYITGTGWESWKDETTYVGAAGKTIEALNIELDGNAVNNYDIYYSVYVNTLGWLGWAKNGENAGTNGYGYRIEGVKVVVVPKGDFAPGSTTGAYLAQSTQNITYRSYKDYMWLPYTFDGAIAGQPGVKMSAFQLKLGTNITDGNVKYRGYISGTGWEGWKDDTSYVGAGGKTIEAFNIEIDGNAADDYDIYYSVNVSNLGWLGWAKNGENAGSNGYGYRIEEIRVVVVAKGAAAPGSTIGAYITQSTYDPLNILNSTSYSSNSNFTETKTDSKGYTTTNNWDDTQGRVNSVTDNAGGRVDYEYDSSGRLNKTTSKMNATENVVNESVFVSDKLSQIIHNGFSYNFTYDAFGQMTKTQVGSVDLVNNEYNNNTHMLTKSTYGNGTVFEPVYDSDYQLTGKKYDGTLAYEYVYGNQGELISIDDKVNLVSTNFLYDLSGRLVKTTDSKDNKWVFGYDEHSNLNSIDKTQFGVEEKESITFNADNMVTNFKLHQGSNLKLDQTIVYDALGRIESIGTKDGNDNSVVNKGYTYWAGNRTENNVTTTLVEKETLGSLVKDYTYDLKGNIETITVGNKVTTYTYDNLSQLTMEVINVDGVETSKIEYDYDTGGNIQTKTVTTDGGTPVVYSYGYDTTWKDKLVSFDGKTITYDSIGNPLSIGGATMTWTQGRKMATFKEDSSSETATYTYDENGIRKSKTIGDEVIEYITSGGEVVAQRSNSGTTSDSSDDVTITFTRGADGSLVSMNRNGTIFYYVTNIQGDVEQILGSTGQVVVSYVYDAYGRVVDISGTLASTIGEENPFRYRSYYLDNESGYYYLQSRYYSAEMGRFISADDRMVDNGNMFAYCGNNPVMKYDKDGHKWNFWSALKNSKLGKAVLSWANKNISMQNKTVIKGKERVFANIDIIIFKVKVSGNKVSEISSGKKKAVNVYSSTNSTGDSIYYGIESKYNSIEVVSDGSMSGPGVTMKTNIAEVSVSNISNAFWSKKSLDIITNNNYNYSVDIEMSENAIKGIILVVVFAPEAIPIIGAAVNKFGNFGSPLEGLGGF
ncbi:MAG: DNRLRE domain-containing protein [Firmicutes bacterium]|nr:DNRLRE domain-containing protein [Bacillota bacterium]